MPWTEDDGYELAVGSLEREDEVGHFLEPDLHLLLLCTAVEDSSHGIAFWVPGILTSDGIPRMPAQSDDAATLMLGKNLAAHAVEGHAVEVLLTVEFKFSEVEAHHCGIVSRDEEHVALPLIPFPGGAIHRIVLMAEHNTFLEQFLQTNLQLFCRRIAFLALAARRLFCLHGCTCNAIHLSHRSLHRHQTGCTQ